jgi:mRNA interferase RelE/StbE
MYRLFYHPTAVKEDIPKLDPAWRSHIKRVIEQKLMVQPESFGQPLRRSLKGYRKLRVGDYRVVFKISNQTVRVLAILHRSVVYKASVKRR